ncbi:GNAT family N-acetyltransferase [Cetobacterium sp. SF1]|uniref:GNAT family N-acetyltransferase n=1 Tax=Cetobacterium sp. SF1 TaxID=3417654 RepID=UPI003CF7BB98
MGIIFREGKLSDCDKLIDLYEELDNLHLENHPEIFITPNFRGRPEPYIKAIIDNPERALIVAEKNSEIIGMAECCIKESSKFPLYKPMKWVQLDIIAVKKEYQSEHIGSALLKEVTDWAKEKEINRVQLTVFNFNERAMDFYEHKGFKTLNKTLFLDLD